jgi:DNA repair photolyase
LPRCCSCEGHQPIERDLALTRQCLEVCLEYRNPETLAAAGVPVGIMCAPIIPGVNDSQMVPVLERAASAGATWAGWVLLRIPGAVKQVLEDRVRVAPPLAADQILYRIRQTRGGAAAKAPTPRCSRPCSTPRCAGSAWASAAATRRCSTKPTSDDLCRPARPTRQLSLF